MRDARDHEDARSVLCEPVARKVLRFGRGDRPEPLRFARRPAPERFVVCFPTSMTELMAERAKADLRRPARSDGRVRRVRGRRHRRLATRRRRQPRALLVGRRVIDDHLETSVRRRPRPASAPSDLRPVDGFDADDPRGHDHAALHVRGQAPARQRRRDPGRDGRGPRPLRLTFNGPVLCPGESHEKGSDAASAREECRVVRGRADVPERLCERAAAR